VPTDRVALVTGASRGIGRAIARRLAADGMAVAAVGRSLHPGSHPLPGSLEETVAEIRGDGGTAIAIALDLSDPKQDRGAVIDEIEQAFANPVNVLVNNAAAVRHFEIGFTTMTREFFAETVEVNVWAAWHLAQLVVPGMVASGAGWILNISSRGAGPRLGPPYPPNQVAGQCLYGSTKAMLDRLTTGAAMELHGSNIAVNALAPEAAVRTENADSVVTLVESVVEPAETMAEAALALCTGDPQAMTGRVAYSLSLLVELQRPVHSLDGRSLLAGWQPGDIDPSRLWKGYLADLR
jgi:citronellol/citronellal dehydrogenase